MKLAFYAPMKPPDDPVPSGDRTIARALRQALAEMGVETEVPSSLRSRDGKGDQKRQAQIMQAAKLEVDRCIGLGRTSGWQAWITYHNYYKAPDLVGPYVARALGIPYLQVESTRARKRLHGDWEAYAHAAEAATDAADVVFYFSHRDAIGLEENQPAGQTLVHLKPFLQRTDLPYATEGFGPLIAVGMMREGDKLASYALIAEALALLQRDEWQLYIAGDGPARAKVEAMMAPFGERVQFLGELSSDGLSDLYQSARILLWPGVNEALGLVYLEAQAHGLLVVAQDRPGMRDVLAPGEYPAVEEGAAGLARVLEQQLRESCTSQAEIMRIRDYTSENNLMPSAVATLKYGLSIAGVTA
ncbi:Glycosyltransferase, group 1 [Sulfitobacter noctilucicola]|uniref:Glycosyltransferase involved in cell wall biosynthesis n=1 Tax=Sulfitobacter noctilucicola TaxID=1342301 RepID=A0A7W6MAA7_9RHOB|nr:glycosyltransferase [Sulfitobacter noctilucicola]KIN63425.1 Glycosyltransferase, group 1 [Sulfitobacter noctilucicola]MBB4175062.1 glycosyltransferase involved in cell wall biosynthesis [Sulfitobacter noctilucicola]